MPLEPPAEQAEANDDRVDGSAGRQQVASPPPAPSWQPPFVTSSAPMLSTHVAEHDSPSTGCIECWAKTLASRSFKSACSCLAPHASGDQSCHKVVEVLEGWLRPHPKQPLDGSDGIRTRQHGLKWPRVDLGRFLRRFFSIAHVRCRMGGSVTFFKYVAPYTTPTRTSGSPPSRTRRYRLSVTQTARSAGKLHGVSAKRSRSTGHGSSYDPTIPFLLQQQRTSASSR